jgi:O-antigen ligase/Flp pilus assembly protein TadD
MSINTKRLLTYTVFASLLAVVLVPLIKTNLFLFPFITGKNFLFRLAVEVGFASWLILIMRHPEYRPRRSPLLWAVLAFVSATALSTIFGVNPYRSFWSNYERMEGLVTFLHLGAFFLMASSVLRAKAEELLFFRTSLGVSLFLSFYGLLQWFGVLKTYQSATRVEATIGNSAYLAMYLLFHIAVAAWLWSKSSRSKGNSFLYGGIVVFEIFVLFLTQTRGTLLGLVAALLVGAGVTAFLQKGKVRQYALGALGGVILLAALFIPLRNSSLVKEIPVLQRLASISLSDTTTKSRFTIWKMGYEGFKEKPIFGWGPENYLVVFNKYYEPSLWPQEPWFDRAHNVFFDWLVMGGIVGLLSYFSLFGASLYILLGPSRKLFSVSERVIFLAIFAGYMVHNLFVFDNITSYITFFSILALLCSRAAGEHKKGQQPTGEGAQSLLIPLVAVLLVFSAYFFVYKGAMASGALMQALGSKSAEEGLTKFKKVFSLNTFGSNEALEQFLIGSVGVLQNQNISNETKNGFYTLANETAAKELTRSKRVDARQLLMYGSYLGRLGNFAEAEKILAEARVLSPRKQQIIFEQINTAINQNKTKEALALAKEVFSLDPSYPEARRIYAIILIVSGKGEEAEKLLADSKEPVTDARVAQAYMRVGQNKKAVNILEKIIAGGQKDSQLYLVLASAYLHSGERAKAVAALEKASELNPNFKAETDFLISEIKAGRNP